jgi:hypothetical protein
VGFFPSRVLYPLHSRHDPGITIPPISGSAPACELDGVFGTNFTFPHCSNTCKRRNGVGHCVILVRFEGHGDSPGSGTGPPSYTVHPSPPNDRSVQQNLSGVVKSAPRKSESRALQQGLRRLGCEQRRVHESCRAEVRANQVCGEEPALVQHRKTQRAAAQHQALDCRKFPLICPARTQIGNCRRARMPGWRRHLQWRVRQG